MNAYLQSNISTFLYHFSIHMQLTLLYSLEVLLGPLKFVLQLQHILCAITAINFEIVIHLQCSLLLALYFAIICCITLSREPYE